MFGFLRRSKEKIPNMGRLSDDDILELRRSNTHYGYPRGYGGLGHIHETGHVFPHSEVRRARLGRKGRKNEYHYDMKFAKNGYSGVINKPTKLIVGEQGPERVIIRNAKTNSIHSKIIRIPKIGRDSIVGSTRIRLPKGLKL